MLAALATGAVDKIKDDQATAEPDGSKETLVEDEEEEVVATLGAVHQAVLDNNPGKVERLIQEDFPLDERDAHSLTPLHLAVSLGREEE